VLKRPSRIRLAVLTISGGFRFVDVETALTDRFHNPWPDRIDDLFAFLGLVKPSRQISWQKASNASVRKNIEDLVRVRNRIAHGSTGTSVVKAGITRWRKYVEGFASRFDNVDREQVKVLAGNYPWSRWSA